MAISVTFYKFAKKMNSTKQPNGSIPSEVFPNCLLKADTDVLRPTIIINQLNLSRKYNYAYIPDFERYYYVTNMLWKDGTWHMTMVIDALASWKTEIGQQSLYVTRCSQTYDGKIMDTLYPAKSNPTYTQIIDDSPWETTDLENGMFVVGVAGQNTTYYKFSFTGLQLFLQYILGELYATDLTDNWSLVYESLNWDANPLQYIVSINWFPFLTGVTGTSTIRVGYVDVPVVCDVVDGSGLVFFSHTRIPPEHPQASARGEYLNNAPYSSYELFYPPFGQLQLDPTLIANSDSIEYLVGVDLRTGKGVLSILDNTNTVLTSWIHAQVSIPYQTTQVMTQGTFDLAKSVGLIGSMLPAMVSGDPTALATGAISGGVNAIGDYARGKIPSARTIGSNGGMTALRGNVALQCEFKLLVDEDNASRGRPYCKKVTLNTLSGYILVTDADVSINCPQAEQQEIRNYLEGGFFIE